MTGNYVFFVYMERKCRCMMFELFGIWWVGEVAVEEFLHHPVEGLTRKVKKFYGRQYLGQCSQCYGLYGSKETKLVKEKKPRRNRLLSWLKLNHSLDQVKNGFQRSIVVEYSEDLGAGIYVGCMDEDLSIIGFDRGGKDPHFSCWLFRDLLDKTQWTILT